MGHYAAVRLNIEDAHELINCISSYRGETVDIVLHPDGTVSIEDDGILDLAQGELVHFFTAEGLVGKYAENILSWIPANPDAPCFVCGRDENEHDPEGRDYNHEGMCTRSDLKGK